MPSSPEPRKLGPPHSPVCAWQPEPLAPVADATLDSGEVRLPLKEAVQPDTFTPLGWPVIGENRAGAAEPAVSLEPAPQPPSGNLVRWQPEELDLLLIGAEPRLAGSGRGGETLRQAQHSLQRARETAGQILRHAEEQASQLLARADARADEVIQQAETRANGVTQEAYQAGLAAARQEIGELLGTASSIVDEVKAWRDEQLAQAEMMMLRLVIDIAQSIFGDGLPLDPETLGQAFSRALSQAKTLGDLRVYVHPEDAAGLNPLWAQRQSALSGQKIEMIPSDIIKRGGCFVEGQYGSVDSRVDTQFQLIKETLLSASASHTAASHAAVSLAAASPAPVSQPFEEEPT